MTAPASGTARDSGERRYLSITRWPDGLDRPIDRASLVAPCIDVGAPDLVGAATRPVPQVLHCTTTPQAKVAMTAIRNAGGAACAPSLAELMALGPTRLVRRLAITRGHLDVEPWREPPFTLPRDAIELLVRGDLREEDAHVARPSPPSRVSGTPWSPGREGFNCPTCDYDLRGHDIDGRCPECGESYSFVVPGPQLANEFGVSMGARASAGRSVNVLDLHTRDGRVFQVNGRKFGFEILGARRELTDNRNIDLLCEMLATLQPRVIVASAFDTWVPPLHARTFRLPGMVLTREVPEFAFYSRWIAALHRHASS